MRTCGESDHGLGHDDTRCGDHAAHIPDRGRVLAAQWRARDRHWTQVSTRQKWGQPAKRAVLYPVFIQYAAAVVLTERVDGHRLGVLRQCGQRVQQADSVLKQQSRRSERQPTRQGTRWSSLLTPVRVSTLQNRGW